VVALALIAIGAATLTPSYGAQTMPGFGCVFCGERALADVLVNVILFTPLESVSRSPARPFAEHCSLVPWPRRSSKAPSSRSRAATPALAT